MKQKDKAQEIVRKHFDIIAKAVNYKGLKIEGEKKFYSIEDLAKKCSIVEIDEIINVIKIEPIRAINIIQTESYWQEIKKEIEKL
jgi:hypothetical protein